MDNALQVICITAITTCIHFGIVYAGIFGNEFGEGWWGKNRNTQFSAKEELKPKDGAAITISNIFGNDVNTIQEVGYSEIGNTDESIVEHVKKRNLATYTKKEVEEFIGGPLQKIVKPKINSLLNLFKRKGSEDTESTPCEGPGCPDYDIYTTTEFTATNDDTMEMVDDDPTINEDDSETTTQNVRRQLGHQNKSKQKKTAKPQDDWDKYDEQMAKSVAAPRPKKLQPKKGLQPVKNKSPKSQPKKPEPNTDTVEEKFNTDDPDSLSKAEILRNKEILKNPELLKHRELLHNPEIKKHPELLKNPDLLKNPGILNNPLIKKYPELLRNRDLLKNLHLLNNPDIKRHPEILLHQDLFKDPQALRNPEKLKRLIRNLKREQEELKEAYY